MKEYLFGDIILMGEGTQIYTSFTPSAIIRRIDDTQSFATEDEADDYMVANGYDAYLCPETYRGRLIKTQDYSQIL